MTPEASGSVRELVVANCVGPNQLGSRAGAVDRGLGWSGQVAGRWFKQRRGQMGRESSGSLISAMKPGWLVVMRH